MPADPKSSTDVAVENDYDLFAEAYTAVNDTSLLNAYYTRPAIVNLAGDVTGRRILDAGCGSGPVSEALRDKGAIVAGFDRSAKWWSRPGSASATTRTCGSPTSVSRCRTPMARSMTASPPWSCTTWRTGPHRWLSCGGC